MLSLVKSQLFTADPELTVSLFTFLFELEFRILNNVPEIILHDGSVITINKKENVNNFLILKLACEEKKSLQEKLELFNYKSSRSVRLDSEGRLIACGAILFSII